LDPDAAEPIRGSTAHADGGDAPVDPPGARAGNSQSDQAVAVRTRPWSRHAQRALVTAWAASASSYHADAHIGEAEDRTVQSGSAES
jgi:hypothetical protein